jgi:CheY-like chemotaxis protein
MKILLVEDNPMNRDMLSRRLARRGFDVVVAVDGREALGMVADEKPDVVLMDLSLPVLSGWEATRRLKAEPETAGIPVIALTAHALSGDYQRAIDAGCDEYETKPVNLDRLIGKIDGLRGANRASSA